MRTGCAEAGAAQPRDVIEDGARLEAELGDDFYREAGRLGGDDLVLERAIKFVGADARVAVGIAGDADAANAASLQKPTLNDVERAPERPEFGAIAGDHQNARDVGLAVESRQKIIERCAGREIPRRDMRHRLEAGGTKRVAAPSASSAGRPGTALR